MKHKWTVSFLMVLLAWMVGCATFKGDPDRPGYKSGRVTAVAYVASEPLLPDNVTEAVGIGYDLVQLVYPGGGVGDDDIIKELIAEEYADRTPEFQGMVFNFYRMAKSSVEQEIVAYPDVTVVEIVTNFIDGVNDALALYRPE